MIKQNIFKRRESLNQKLNNQSSQDIITNIIAEMREERIDELVNSFGLHE